MDKVILAISGRKQSGKSSTFDYIASRAFGRKDVAVAEFSFADPLKKLCVDVLGLEPRQVYGSNEDKNSPVPHLLWENFPVAGCWVAWRRSRFGISIPYLKTGPMTGREVLQYWGTDIFRAAYGDVWADAAIRSIRRWFDKLESAQEPLRRAVAVLPDCRFPNEVRVVKDAGGKVLRLTRAPHDEDVHVSETALDADRYDWTNFDLVCDNSRLSQFERDAALRPWLRDINAID